MHGEKRMGLLGLAVVCVGVVCFTLGVFLSSAILPQMEERGEGERGGKRLLGVEADEVAEVDDVVINEFVPYPTEGEGPWVELYNTRGSPRERERREEREEG